MTTWRVATGIGLLAMASTLLVAGTTTIGEEALPEKLSLRPVSYELDLRVDYDERRVHGRSVIHLLNSGTVPVDHVPLLLYRMMRATSVADGSGNPLRFAQRVVSFVDFEVLQINSVRVSLSEPLAPDRRTTVEIRYEGPLRGYAETGMTYVRDSVDPDFTILRRDAYAYPVVGYPSDRVNREAGLFAYDYEARVTVPENLIVANGGELIGRRNEAGSTTWSYRNRKAAWRMDFAIAPYESLSRLELTVFHLPGDREGALQVMRAFGRAVELFSKWFGPLESAGGFTVIEMPEGFGAQADVTSILQPAPAFRDSGEMYRLYHEASHLWNVDSTTLPSPRLEEGLATFLQWLAVDVLEERQELDRALDRILGRVRSRFEEQPRLRQIPLGDYGRERITDLSYSVGALFFAVLYDLVGQDKFNEIIGGFHRRYVSTGASLGEFASFVREVGGSRLALFLKEWLESVDFVDRILTAGSTKAIAEAYR